MALKIILVPLKIILVGLKIILVPLKLILVALKLILVGLKLILVALKLILVPLKLFLVPLKLILVPLKIQTFEPIGTPQYGKQRVALSIQPIKAVVTKDTPLPPSRVKIITRSDLMEYKSELHT